MLLPFREHLDFGPTPYDQLQEKEGIPSIRGNVVADVKELELAPWKRMGALGCFLNLSDQQLTDAYVCEIPAGRQSVRPRRLADEGRGGEAYALHAGGHDVRLSCLGVSPQVSEHVSPPRARRRHHDYAGGRLHNALERWRGKKALRFSRGNG